MSWRHVSSSSSSVLLYLYCSWIGCSGLIAVLHAERKHLYIPVTQQEKQSFHEPLSWSYPGPPAEEEPRYPPNFELKAPAAANSVSAVCQENSVRVEAKRDLLGIGQLVQASDVTLGGCAATGQDPDAQVLIFESELHGCGSQLLVRHAIAFRIQTLI